MCCIKTWGSKTHLGDGSNIYKLLEIVLVGDIAVHSLGQGL